MAKIRCRKWQLTFNNPEEHGVTHEIINNICKASKCIYWCLSDEIGAEEHTPHTHLFICFENARSFDVIKSWFFGNPHIEKCNGTCQDNRDYIRKEGRHSDKSITSIPDTFEEYGEMPQDTKSKNETVSAEILEMLENGVSTNEIVHTHPSYINKIGRIEEARQMILAEKFKDEYRQLDIEYIYGETGTGKTRFIMEKYGYSNVYRINSYKNPFDNYKGQDIIVFDEFRSSIPLADMLQYLDGYPCVLPSRYADKTACYTKVVLISNIPFDKQFSDVQRREPESWNAFVRRFDRITKFERAENLPYNNESEIVQILENPEKFKIKGC